MILSNCKQMKKILEQLWKLILYIWLLLSALLRLTGLLPVYRNGFGAERLSIFLYMSHQDRRMEHNLFTYTLLWCRENWQLCDYEVGRLKHKILCLHWYISGMKRMITVFLVLCFASLHYKVSEVWVDADYGRIHHSVHWSPVTSSTYKSYYGTNIK